MKHVLLLLLAIWTPLPASQLERSVDQEWLKVCALGRFSLLTHLHPQSVEGYQEKLLPYLRARGVDDNAVELFVRKDLFHIAHALSILFEQESAHVLQHFLGDRYALIDRVDAHIDHVGRELLGSLSFYLPLLKKLSPELGLVAFMEIVFPSTQVVKVLQHYDPNISGVTIGRMYFQDISNGQIRCLELFQASSQDDQCPQKITATEDRLLLLTAPSSSSLQTPIDHLALEVGAIEDVQSIHDRIHQLASETLMPYQKTISYNPGDGSTQTKVLLRDSTETVFNKIIEFVHYEHPSKPF